jgi:A/G-specific adenine glycosylase
MDDGDKLTRAARAKADQIRRVLLAWYDVSRRDLPWRAAPGASVDPYAVWLSEIMLQQTTVKAAIPYFETFLRRWPNVGALASAERDKVMSAWAGLGYYSRARNMHEAAAIVARDFGGRFPDTLNGLLALPGVGPYTAAAIVAIAFNGQAAVVDGNVERVLARLFALTTPMPAAKGLARQIAEQLAPPERPGDFAQAMMDLGATVCTPKRPACGGCPLGEMCGAKAAGLSGVLPYREAKRAKPQRSGRAYFAMTPDGAVLLRRRPDKGLLGGMMEVPSSGWNGAADRAGGDAPFEGAWRLLPGTVRHTFTHFHLELEVFCLEADRRARLNFGQDGEDWRWVPRRDLSGEALPSLMRKVIAHALSKLDRKAA